jgi:hypothetical protein
MLLYYLGKHREIQKGHFYKDEAYDTGGVTYIYISVTIFTAMKSH